MTDGQSALAAGDHVALLRDPSSGQVGRRGTVRQVVGAPLGAVALVAFEDGGDRWCAARCLMPIGGPERARRTTVGVGRTSGPPR